MFTLTSLDRRRVWCFDGIMKLKIFMAALAVILIVLVLIVGIPNPFASEPPPDIPRYTADQVLIVAQAYSPGTERSEYATRQGYPNWSVKYLGDGVWRINKDNFILADETFLFDEATGSIR